MPFCLYRHFNKFDRLLAITVASTPAERFAQFRNAPWLSQVHRTSVQYARNRRAALAALKEAIKAERPRYQ